MQAEVDMASPNAEAAERILVVDDDPGIRDVVSEFLQRHGYSVETAADVTVSELVIESFYPADAETAVRMRTLG